jgi:hypothetical protein
MPLDALMNAGEGFRYGLALVTTLVLAYWTYQRVIAGSGEDPNISLSYGDRDGYLGFVMSGIIAVAFVAGGWVLGLGPEVMAQPALLAIPAAFLIAHTYFEVSEG